MAVIDSISVPYEVKSVPGCFKTDIDGDSRTVRQIFSVTGVIDSFGDRMKAGAFKKTIKERIGRIQVLWAHSMFDPPIGVPVGLEEISKSKLPEEVRDQFPEATGGLMGTIEYLDTPRGNEVLQGIRRGAIRENSIGFDAVKVEWVEDGRDKIRDLLEVRLWDLSPVNWGANPATMNLKGAVPFKSTGADKEGQWSKPSLGDFTPDDWDDLPEQERRRIAMHFAWVSEMPPPTFGDCKLPHHNPAKSGIGSASWKGVTAAMSRLMQSATQVDDKEAVYRHLARHYKDDFDEEPPDLKVFQLSMAVQNAMALGPVQLGKAYDALVRLNTAMTEAEPRALPALTLELQKAKVQGLKHILDMTT